MKLTLQTQKLQEMLSKAIKGASNNRMIPITGLVAIHLKDEVLTLITTDASNTLKVVEKGIKGDDFYAAIQVDLFSKLVAKTTAENIVLTLQEGSLEVKGNGSYRIELPLDEDGKLIQFPDPKFDYDATKSSLKLSDVKSVLIANKAALALTMENPCLTGYYFDDKAITTDTFKVCINAVKLFNEKALLPAELVELLSLCDEETIQVQRSNGKVLFTTKTISILGHELPDIQNYPAAAIESYLDTEFQSYCDISKAEIMSVLDRLSLFVTVYDKNGIYLTFSEDALIISSKKSNSTESVKCLNKGNFQPFTLCADIELLMSQLSAQPEDAIKLWYGNPTVIKMTSEKLTQIVALLEDDRV